MQFLVGVPGIPTLGKTLMSFGLFSERCGYGDFAQVNDAACKLRVDP